MTFGAAAERLCGTAAQVLGWRPAEFWDATPAELAACLGLSATEHAAVARDTLVELLNRFPDESTDNHG